MIFGHGDDTYRFGDKIKMNFSSNVYYGADYSALKAHLMEHFDVISHYPEPERPVFHQQGKERQSLVKKIRERVSLDDTFQLYVTLLIPHTVLVIVQSVSSTPVVRQRILDLWDGGDTAGSLYINAIADEIVLIQEIAHRVCC